MDANTIKEVVARWQKQVDLLEHVGKALDGDRWQTQLAKALRVSDRTVRRWVLFESPIPWSFLDEKLPPLFKAKAENLTNVLKELVTWRSGRLQ
jgi:hypothetical protein